MECEENSHNTTPASKTRPLDIEGDVYHLYQAHHNSTNTGLIHVTCDICTAPPQSFICCLQSRHKDLISELNHALLIYIYNVKKNKKTSPSILVAEK